MSAPVADLANHTTDTGQPNQHIKREQSVPGASPADSRQQLKPEYNAVKAEPSTAKAEPSTAKAEPSTAKAEPSTAKAAPPVSLAKAVPSQAPQAPQGQVHQPAAQIASTQGPLQAHSLSHSVSAPGPATATAPLQSVGQPSSSQPAASQAAPASQPESSGPPPSISAQAQGQGQPDSQVSTSDIQCVQNYIERCLQMYLSQKEVILHLQQQFRVEPCFTQLVWQKLEEQNQEFFKAYYTRLKLKDQIILFNHLLDEQVKMFQRIPPRAGMSIPGGMQPRPGLATGFPQTGQQPAAPGQPAMQQAATSSQMQGPAVTAPSTRYPMHSAADSSLQNAQLSTDPGQLHVGDFPGLGIDGSSGDLPADLGIGQSLPFSGSEMNLAGMVSLGSPGRGSLGGAGDHVDLSRLPRNFSLSDLGALAPLNDGDDGGLPRNLSLLDLPLLDLDSGGEQG